MSLARAEQKGVMPSSEFLLSREQLPTLISRVWRVPLSLRLFSVSRLMQVFLLIHPDASLLFSQCCVNTLKGRCFIHHYAVFLFSGWWGGGVFCQLFISRVW
eukprot:4359552-Heterocapsa_arctica.AAC.1